MLIEELDAFRPLHYSGRDSNGSNGHAFICDGYQGTDYFHFNWVTRGQIFNLDKTTGVIGCNWDLSKINIKLIT